MLKVAVGHSDDPDSLSAIDEAIEHCQNSLAGMTPQAGILFSAIGFDHSLILQRIQAAFPGIELIGCTTDGEISSVLAFQQDSIVLTLFCSDEIQIRAGVGRNVSQDSIAAAREAMQQARTDVPARLCLTVPESLTTSGIAILNGLKTVFGQDFPIYGGLAGEEWKFQQTFQFYQTEVLRDAVPILLFSGSTLKFSHGVQSGFQPVSAAGRVTKVDRNILYEIDGQPALAFYREYFGDLTPSPEHPFAVFETETDHFYLRGFSSFDPVVGSITSFADIPEHAIVKMATASRDEILVSSKQAMLDAFQNYPGSEPEVALLFSCASRWKILGTRAREEFALVQDCLSPTLSTAGFYTYGELAPLGQQHETQLHQDTLVTLLLGTR
jgi:hypothetical protein